MGMNPEQLKTATSTKAKVSNTIYQIKFNLHLVPSKAKQSICNNNLNIYIKTGRLVR